MTAHVQQPIESAVERIERVYALMGSIEDFNRVLPDLENYLESQIAAGETSEHRLAVDGLTYLRKKMTGASPQ
jgi:hypothetical protein